MANNLEGKVVIVTGASRGIGKVIALQMAEDGAMVVVAARTETPSEEYPGSIHQSVAEISAKGGNALAVKLDVTDDAAIREAVKTVKREYGKIDVLVNNAGILGAGGPFLDGDPELLDRFYRTNLRAPYVLTQIVGQEMASAGGGIIFNISSGLARMPNLPDSRPDSVTPAGGASHGGGMPAAHGGFGVGSPHGGFGMGGAHGGSSMSPSAGGGRRGASAVYGATKAALDRFAAGVAPELQDRNIAIITIYPGMTITERMMRNLPTGTDTSRMEQPETTAKAISYLCGNPMSYTGQVVVARELVEEHKL